MIVHQSFFNLGIPGILRDGTPQSPKKLNSKWNCPFSTSKWFLLFGYKTITNLVSLVIGNLLMAKSRSDVKESGKVARECVRLACYKTCVCKWVIFSSVAPTIIDKYLGACQITNKNTHFDNTIVMYID